MITNHLATGVDLNGQIVASEDTGISSSLALNLLYMPDSA